jgi:hypothetical protein
MLTFVGTANMEGHDHLEQVRYVDMIMLLLIGLGVFSLEMVLGAFQSLIAPSLHGFREAAL